MLLSGYWVKLVDPASYLSGVAAHLEITRFMNPAALTAGTDAYEVRGDATEIIMNNRRDHNESSPRS